MTPNDTTTADLALLRADRVSFEVATAETFTGTGYDLVTTFDCLHDMGDPLAAARRVREAPQPNGSRIVDGSVDYGDGSSNHDDSSERRNP